MKLPCFGATTDTLSVDEDTWHLEATSVTLRMARSPTLENEEKPEDLKGDYIGGGGVCEYSPRKKC